MELFGYKIEKAQKQKVPTSPIGIIGMKTSTDRVNEEFISALQWPTAGLTYQEMSSNDAVVGGCLYIIETIVRSARWFAKPASEDAGDVEAAQFLESCMFDMQEQTWDDFICDVLSMLTYGFSFHEIVYKTRRGPLEKDLKFKSNYSDGKIGWQCLPIRSQASLDSWEIEQSTGKVLSFVQDPGTVGLNAPKKAIPIEGNLLFKTKSVRGNPEGWSILRRAYRSWYFKKYIEELEGIGVERSLAGIPILAPPPDVALFDTNNEEMVRLLAWSQDLVSGLRQDSNHGVVLPNTDWQLKLLGADGAGKAPDTDKIIRRHEARIASSMLSDLILLGGDASGSFALSATKQSMLIRSLQAIVGAICATLNTYAVPKLFAANNWTLEKLPTIAVEALDSPSPSDIALILRSLKVDVTKSPKLFNYLMSLIQAPTLTPEEFEELMTQSEAEGETGGSEGATEGDNDDFQDPAENSLKQSDKLTR